MSKKKIAALICGGIGIIGLIGMFGESRSTSLLVGSVVLLLAGVGLFAWDHFAPKKQEDSSSVTSVYQPVQTESSGDIERVPSKLDLVSDGCVLRYSYMCDLETPVASAARSHAGEPVDFEGKDVHLNGVRIGSIKEEKQVTMIGDYARRGDSVKAFIRMVSSDTVSIELGFYKSKDSLKTKECKVGGGSKYAEDRFTCSVGDLVTITEDDESDKLLVEYLGTPIGTLSASVADTLNTNHLIVGEIVVLDNDLCKVKLYI